MPPNVKALGGRTVATGPRNYPETLKGVLLSLYHRLVGD